MIASKIVVLAAAALGFGLSSGASDSNSSAKHERSSMVVVGSGLLEGPCVLECAAENCPANSHEANPGGDKTAGGAEHGCASTGATCMQAHGCGISALPSTPDLLRMVANEDVSALRRALPDHNLMYVAERATLQIVADCGAILAQIPITSSVATSLSFH